MSIDVKALKEQLIGENSKNESLKPLSFKGHTNHIFNLAITTDRKILVSASYDGSIRTWSLETGKQIANFTIHKAPINHMALAKNNNTIISADLEGRIYCSFISSGNSHEITQDNSKGRIDSLRLGADGDTLVWSCQDKINVWSLKNGWISQFAPKTFGKLHSGPNGQIIIDNMNTLVNMGTDCIALTPNNKWVVCNDRNADDLKCFSLETHKFLKVISANASITCMDISANGEILVTGHRNSTVTAWSLKTATRLFVTPSRLHEVKLGEQLHHIIKSELHYMVKTVNLLNDNDTLIVGWYDGTVGIYSLGSKKCLSSFRLNQAIIQSIAAFRQDRDLCLAIGSMGHLAPGGIDFRSIPKIFPSELDLVQTKFNKATQDLEKLKVDFGKKIRELSALITNPPPTLPSVKELSEAEKKKLCQHSNRLPQFRLRLEALAIKLQKLNERAHPNSAACANQLQSNNPATALLSQQNITAATAIPTSAAANTAVAIAVTTNVATATNTQANAKLNHS